MKALQQILPLMERKRQFNIAAIFAQCDVTVSHSIILRCFCYSVQPLVTDKIKVCRR